MTFTPDYNPEDGLNSLIFSHPSRFTPACIHKLPGALLHDSADYPLCWVPDTDYEEVLSWFSDTRPMFPFTGFITNTQHEADGIWQDFCTRFISGSLLFPTMKCTLVNDPGRPALWLQSHFDNPSSWSVSEIASNDLVGNDFRSEDIEQLEITPFHRTIFRLYRRLIYYSSTSITKQRLLTISSYAFDQVIILASKENMRDLMI
jgi:hypothetical protein